VANKDAGVNPASVTGKTGLPDHQGLVELTFPESPYVEGDGKDHVRFMQILYAWRIYGKMSQGGESGERAIEFECADERGDRFFVLHSGPGTVKGKCIFQAQSAEVVMAAQKRHSAAGASRGGEEGNVGQAVVAQNRKFPARKPLIAFKAIGGKNQFLQWFNEKIKHGCTGPVKAGSTNIDAAPRSSLMGS